MGRRKNIPLWFVPIHFGYSFIKDILSWDPWVPGKRRRRTRKRKY